MQEKKIVIVNEDIIPVEFGRYPMSSGVEYEIDPIACEKIGDILTLNTANKTNLVYAINECLAESLRNKTSITTNANDIEVLSTNYTILNDEYKDLESRVEIAKKISYEDIKNELESMNDEAKNDYYENTLGIAHLMYGSEMFVNYEKIDLLKKYKYDYWTYVYDELIGQFVYKQVVVNNPIDAEFNKILDKSVVVLVECSRLDDGSYEGWKTCYSTNGGFLLYSVGFKNKDDKECVTSYFDFSRYIEIPDNITGIICYVLE